MGFIRRRALVLALAACTSCASLSDKMRQVHTRPCANVLADHESIAGHDDYADLSRVEREDYEVGVANCHLHAGRPESAVALAKTWSTDTPDRHMVLARASATLKDEKGVREALHGLSSAGGTGVDFFLDDLFDPYRREDWFVGEAVAGWNSERDSALEQFLGRLLHRSGEQLLPLRLAAADPGRAPGEWVLWLGLVRHSKLEREYKRTVLFAEGAEIQEELKARETRVEKVETEHKKDLFNVKKLTDFQWTVGYSTSTPKYGPTVSTFEESFVPNGHRFIVRFNYTSESLATLPAVNVLGRFRGRDGESGQLVIEAVVAQPRTPRRTTSITAP